MTRRARFWWAAGPVAVEALAALWWCGRSAGRYTPRWVDQVAAGRGGDRVDVA
jgi:hypothetical protein